MDKKSEAYEKQRFALHVSLLMVQRGINKSQAQFQAWIEGPKGLETILAQLDTKEQPK